MSDGVNFKNLLVAGDRCYSRSQSITPPLTSCVARDLTLEAAQSAGSSRGYSVKTTVRDLPFTQIKKLLDSKHDREILEGLRKVISVSQHDLLFGRWA